MDTDISEEDIKRILKWIKKYGDTGFFRDLQERDEDAAVNFEDFLGELYDKLEGSDALRPEERADKSTDFLNNFSNSDKVDILGLNDKREYDMEAIRFTGEKIVSKELTIRESEERVRELAPEGVKKKVQRYERLAESEPVRKAWEKIPRSERPREARVRDRYYLAFGRVLIDKETRRKASLSDSYAGRLTRGLRRNKDITFAEARGHREDKYIRRLRSVQER